MRRLPGLPLVVLLAGCTASPAPRDAASDVEVPQIGGTVLVLDQSTQGRTTGSAAASFPGAFLEPPAQGVVPGIQSTTTKIDQCVVATPPTCSPACAGTDATPLLCTGPNACSAPVAPGTTQSVGTITIYGAAACPLVLTIQSGVGIYGNGAPAGALLAARYTLHVMASGGQLPAFEGDVQGVDDLAVTAPAFPADGTPVPLPSSGGLTFSWSPRSADVLAIQLTAVGPAGETLVDCRPADSAGTYTVPQAALDPLRAGGATDAGAATLTAFVRRIRDVTVSTAEGPVHLVVESVVSGALSP